MTTRDIFNKGERYLTPSGTIIRILRDGSPYLGWWTLSENTKQKFHLYPEDKADLILVEERSKSK